MTTRDRTLPQLDRLITTQRNVYADTRNAYGQLEIAEIVEYTLWAKRLDFTVRDQLALSTGGGVITTRFLVRADSRFEWSVGDSLESDGVSWDVRGVSEAGTRGAYLYLLVRAPD